MLDVERGWRGRREVNRVRYDPTRVSVVQLEQWLRDAGTYLDTLEE